MKVLFFSFLPLASVLQVLLFEFFTQDFCLIFLINFFRLCRFFVNFFSGFFLFFFLFFRLLFLFFIRVFILPRQHFSYRFFFICFCKNFKFSFFQLPIFIQQNRRQSDLVAVSIKSFMKFSFDSSFFFQSFSLKLTSSKHIFPNWKKNCQKKNR